MPPRRCRGNAVELFTRAGHAALADQAERSTWWQFYLEFPDWSQAEATAAAVLRPILFDAEAEGSVTAWWYTRTHLCWQLCLGIHPDPGARASIGAALDELAGAGHLQRWWPGIYEPEITAFGGSASVEASHYLFSAASRETLALADRSDVSIGRRKLSVLLCSIRMRAARLEWYEQGDAWQRVIGEDRTALGRVPEDRLMEMTKQLRKLSHGAPYRGFESHALCVGWPLTSNYGQGPPGFSASDAVRDRPLLSGVDRPDWHASGTGPTAPPRRACWPRAQCSVIE
ncbi:thiopeptide-type bacteriocin biosynthesis protein [Streptomyces sp. NPDC057565]|uniref:thiopeptide-type bacteriocin biosynthesis protein n=1 Tax=Streptomyces sp. NPDC057565 TaxID=3346169 RepID=UPI0036BBB1FD